MNREKEFLWKAQKLGLPLCQVWLNEKGKQVYAFFHGWEQTDKVLISRLSNGISGHPVRQVYGLCEDENGMIKRVDPESIRFVRIYDERIPDFGGNQHE